MSGQRLYRINEPHISSEEIDGEVIIVNLLNGNYYSAQDMGAYVWGRISHGESLEALQASLGEHFAEHDAKIRTDLPAFFEKLESEELIINANGSGATANTVINSGLPAQYEAPNLNCYSDMNDLLLLDPIHDVEEDAGWPKQKQAWPTNEPDSKD